MKTIKLTILTLLVLGNIKIINAQNWLLQGNAIQSTDYLGTNDTNALVFSTNAIERMRLTNKGFLGIGTAIPSTKLEIYSPSTFGNLLRVYGQGSSNITQPDLTPFTFATFIQSDNSKADAGIRIQGARTHNDRADIAFIDLANLDNDNSGAYIMSRIAGGLMDQDPTPGPPTTPAQTNDRGYLKFYTNAGKLPYGTGEGLMERMRITDLGLVGIGTSTPTAKLSVYQNNLYHPALSITKEIPATSPYGNLFEITKKVTGTSTTEYVFVVRDTGRVGIGTDNPTDKLTVAGTIASTTGGFKFPDGTVQTSAATNYGNWAINGNDMYSAVSGKVGIGTNSPQKQLHVKTLHSGIQGSHYGIRLEDIYASTSSSVWDLEPIGSNGKFHIGTHGNRILTLTSNERMGLGTVSPQAKLDVNGTGHFSGLVGIGTLNPIAELHVKAIPNSNCDIVMESAYGHKWDLAVNGTDGSFGLYQPSTGLTRLHVSVDGNVGIGTSTPSQKLQVAGNIQLTDHLIFNTTGYPHGVIDWPAAGDLWFRSNPTAGDISSYNTRMRIDGTTGNIGIGNMANPLAKLHIEVTNDNDKAFAVYKDGVENFLITGDGKFYARGYRIKLGSFPDYVFEDSYKRMTYEERALYYLKNKHLPGIATAKQVKEEGLDVGNTLTGLTLNLEEISLNQIDLYKLLKAQQKQLDELKKENELLKQLIK